MLGSCPKFRYAPCFSTTELLGKAHYLARCSTDVSRLDSLNWGPKWAPDQDFLHQENCWCSTSGGHVPKSKTASLQRSLPAFSARHALAAQPYRFNRHMAYLRLCVRSHGTPTSPTRYPHNVLVQDVREVLSSDGADLFYDVVVVRRHPNGFDVLLVLRCFIFEESRGRRQVLLPSTSRPKPSGKRLPERTVRLEKVSSSVKGRLASLCCFGVCVKVSNTCFVSVDNGLLPPSRFRYLRRISTGNEARGGSIRNSCSIFDPSCQFLYS